MSARGSGLVEAVTALLLLALLLHAGWTVVDRQRRAVAALVSWEEGLETVRIARWVLADELRAGLAGRDWSAPRSDSVGLRAFRGTALVCPAAATPDEGMGRLLVHHRGVRRPDPAKDSLLLLDGRGRWVPLELEAVERADVGCAGAPALDTEWWTVAGGSGTLPAGAGTVARLYERGSYHLADGALRYRRGRGGRQPLTAARLDPSSGLRAREDGSVVVELRVLDGPSPGSGWGGRWSLREREGPR